MMIEFIEDKVIKVSKKKNNFPLNLIACSSLGGNFCLILVTPF